MDNKIPFNFSAKKKESLEEHNELLIENFSFHIKKVGHTNVIPEFFNGPFLCTWEITRACNLICEYCYNNSQKKLPSELSSSEKRGVAEQIVNMKIFRVCLSGGEPLLDNSFWNIAAILNKGRVNCSTITNGFFVTQKIAKRLSNYFTKVQVSIDGTNPETHDNIRGVNGSWEKAINACKYILNNNIRLWICFVPNIHNITEIEEMIDLAYNLGAERFRTERTKLTGRAAKNLQVIPSEKQYKDFEKIIRKKIKEYNGKMYIEYGGDAIANYLVPHLRFGIPIFHLYISPSGTCSCSGTIPFLGISVRDKTLNEIWDKLKIYHKEKEFIDVLNSLKSNLDYLNLPEIPYVNRELHDK